MLKVENLITWLFIAGVCAVGALTTYFYVDRDAAKVVCLRAGYPEVRVTSAEWFCVKRQDNTDAVVPMADVKGARRG